LFTRLQVVIDDHLAIRAEQCAAHLYRRQPVDVVVGDQLVVEEAGQVCHVDGMPGNVGGARRRHGTGRLAEDVVHDGQVVHGQIPEDIDVVLEQSEIHPHGVVVIDPT